MKQLKDNPAPAFQLYRKKDDAFTPTLTTGGHEIWACGECGTLHARQYGETSIREKAEECCKQKYCSCGEKMPQYWVACHSCSSRTSTANRTEKATEIEQFDGAVYCAQRDKYWSNLEEFQDWAACRDEDEDLPEWLFTCAAKKFARIDASDVVQSELEEHHEDAEVDDIEELQEFLNKWCDKQSLESLQPDYSRKLSVAKILAAVAGEAVQPKE
jgi:hypothetical protein